MTRRPLALLALLVGAAGAARRALVEADLAYNLRAWNRTYRTRAHALFPSDAHFRARLFAYESALGEAALQSFHVQLAPGVWASDALRASSSTPPSATTSSRTRRARTRRRSASCPRWRGWCRRFPS